MSIQLPVQYTDLVYKDPDGAVCACMSRDRLEISSAECPAAVETEAPIGRIGCGMRCYSPLGTEIWGRSLLVFHRFDLATALPSPGFRILRLAQGARTCPKASEHAAEQTAEHSEVRCASIHSMQNAIATHIESDSLRDQFGEDLEIHKKRKSEGPRTETFS